MGIHCYIGAYFASDIPLSEALMRRRDAQRVSGSKPPFTNTHSSRPSSPLFLQAWCARATCAWTRAAAATTGPWALARARTTTRRRRARRRPRKEGPCATMTGCGRCAPVRGAWRYCPMESNSVARATFSLSCLTRAVSPRRANTRGRSLYFFISRVVLGRAAIRTAQAAASFHAQPKRCVGF